MGALNAALPLEYAIRAARLMAPEDFKRLEEIDRRMHDVWRSEGYANVQIRHDNLVDGCWDLFQFHYIEDRNPTRLLHKDVRRVREIVVRQFESEVGKISLPFSDQYRVCDLLNGNDIGKLIKEISKKRDVIRKVSSEEQYLPLSVYILSIRRPIPRYRGSVQQVYLRTEDGATATHIGLMLDPYMSLDDMHGALHEFLYHYAIFRRENRTLFELDPVGNKLIMDWGLPAAPAPGAEVTQLNELHTALNGLHCWDRQKFHEMNNPRGALNRAKEEVQALYEKEDGDDGISITSINTHYKRVKERIDKLCQDELDWQLMMKRRTNER